MIRAGRWTSTGVRGGLVGEIAGALCVLVVVNGLLLCAAARLSRSAPYTFLVSGFDLLNTALAPALIAMAVATVAALLIRPTLGVVLAVITVAAMAWQLSAVLADAAPRRVQAGGEIVMRVLTLNAFHDNPDPERLRRVIEAAAADVVLIEEADGSASDAVMRALPSFYRLTHCNGGRPCSIMMLSRWPAVRVATPMPGEPELPDMLYARLALPRPARSGPTIDVVAVHLPRGYRPMAARFRALTLATLQRARSGPVILAGDFNLPTGSLALADVAHEGGLRRADRWIATYPADRWFPAFAAIDHIFVDPALGVRTCRRLPFAGSDHYGIVCDIILPTGG